MFRHWQKVSCHGNGMLLAKYRAKCFIAKLLYQCSSNSYGIHMERLSLNVGQHDAFLDSDKKCVALETAHIIIMSQNDGKS